MRDNKNFIFKNLSMCECMRVRKREKREKSIKGKEF